MKTDMTHPRGIGTGFPACPSGERPGNVLLSCRSGFTLLELMVSFMIIAMMVGILTGALRLGISAVSSGEKRIDSLERLGASVRLISSQIQSLNSLTFEEDGVKRYFFEGDSESLQFSSNFAVWGGQKGFVLVKYAIQEDETEGLQLAVTENLLGFESERETLLLDALESASFEYFQRDLLNESGEWLDTWDDTQRLPTRIRLTFVRGGEEYSLVFPVRVIGSIIMTPSGSGFGAIPAVPEREPEPEEDPNWRPRSQR